MRDKLLYVLWQVKSWYNVELKEYLICWKQVLLRFSHGTGSITRQCDSKRIKTLRTKLID